MSFTISPDTTQQVRSIADRLQQELAERLVGKSIHPIVRSERVRCPDRPATESAVQDVLAVCTPGWEDMEMFGLWDRWVVMTRKPGQEDTQINRCGLQDFLEPEELHNLFRRAFRGVPVPVRCAQPSLRMRTGMPFTERAAPRFIRGRNSVVLSPRSPLLLRPVDRNVPQPWDGLSAKIDESAIVFQSDPDSVHLGPNIVRFELAEVVPGDSPMLVLKVGCTVIPISTVLAVNPVLKEVELLPYQNIEASELSSR